MAVRKKFSRSMYNLVDGPAREALVKHLESKGHTIHTNKEDYNVDVTSERDGMMFYSEVEVKLGWEGDWNPKWSEIRLPERKSRLLEKHRGNTGVLNFYIISGDWKHMWCINETQLTQESLAEAKGRWIQKGELFFHIPYTEAELIVL